MVTEKSVFLLTMSSWIWRYYKDESYIAINHILKISKPLQFYQRTMDFIKWRGDKKIS